MIRMVLRGIRQLDIDPLADDPNAEVAQDFRAVDVLACAICRTDAKMWDQGHRDLIFPRVLGHEMVVRDAGGQRYIVWPGNSCGQCPYCRGGRENLCDTMQITGFHSDGGFAHRAVLPLKSLIPVPEALETHAGCFAEPVACVINAFDKLPLAPGKKLLIYGGGTMGLITALYARHIGLSPLILEKDAAKMQKITPILEAWGIACLQETFESHFPLVINACPDYAALCQAVTKVDKGGHISFFSGITKNESMETNLLNLIHYREASITGGYGMRRSDIENAVPFLISHAQELRRLIEAVVRPEQAPKLMPKVLSGQHFKYILDFTGTGSHPPEKITVPQALDHPNPSQYRAETLCRKAPTLWSAIKGIRPLDTELAARAKSRMDDKAKPLGALGRLEPLAVRICRIQNTLSPRIRDKAMLVFAGDHGVAEEGVSAFPAEVTGQMVDNYLNGGAAINVMCRRMGIPITIVDIGVRKTFPPHPNLIRSKVARGTRNMALEPAMTEAQTVQALEAGVNAFLSVRKKSPVDILGLGEMGIGNTTAASAIISAVTGLSPDRTTGRGTGMDNQGLTHKAEVIQRVLNLHSPDPGNGLHILSAMGGFEIAGIAGAALAAASHGCAVVLDGVISTAAGLIAHLLNPDIADYFIAGHKSVEIAHTAALEHMGLDPLVDLAMRLGEGTGAALAMDLADTACCLMDQMASFDEAKISRKSGSPYRNRL